LCPLPTPLVGPACTNTAVTLAIFLTLPSLSTRSRALIEKLIVARVFKKVPVSYGTRTFIAVFTRTCYSQPDESSPHPQAMYF
jgi:hypothetical protein